MTTPPTLIRRLPEDMDLEQFLGRLTTTFGCLQEPERHARRVYFDTFDWRLYRRGYLLCRENSAYHLLDLRHQGNILASQSGPPSQPLLATALPPGPVRETVAPITGIRALLPLVTLQTTTRTVRICNRDEKTVALLTLEKAVLEDVGTLIRTLRLTGIRGYDKRFKKVQRFLDQEGVREKTVPFAGFLEGLQSQGRFPGDYSSKFTLSLEPDLTARAAAILIFKQLLETMRCNEAGIIQDLDSEFLHDFRVALRRTRSGLSQLKKVLPDDIVAHFKKEFAYLGKLTGPTRDLDVYLLKEKEYHRRVPPLLFAGLETLFQELSTRRQREQQRLVRGLTAPRYKQILQDWQRVLDADNLEPTANSDRPIIDLARQIITGNFRRIQRDGRNIDRNTPDEKLHRLRIQCKKLRYNLEFFRSLFPEEEIGLLIKQLKRLQDNLGDFNDLSVQQEMLTRYLAAIKPGSRKKLELGAAIGGLVTNLFHEQQRVRKKFHRIFKRFTSGSTRRLFASLFQD